MEYFRCIKFAGVSTFPKCIKIHSLVVTLNFKVYLIISKDTIQENLIISRNTIHYVADDMF